MSPHLKPIKVWGQGGPNPPKVVFILEELGLPYEVIDIQHAFTTDRSPEYLAINPNGRVPAIQDPNSDLTLWESGAIIEYLIERYDTTHKLSFPPGTPESYHAKQWLFFQTTGQGPYYGQAIWFKRSHPEKLPSAIERYTKEVNRVSGVLEGHLSKQKEKYGEGPWLVGNKCSYVDTSFVTYQVGMGFMLTKDEYDVENFPTLKEWLGKLTLREAVKKVLENTAPFNRQG
jgi:glutathione S-transferase